MGVFEAQNSIRIIKNQKILSKIWILAIFWNIGCTKLQKNPKKSKSHTFFFVINSKLVREHFGPKKMTPPLGSNVCYFCNFISIFWFSTKKIWPTLKWPKNFFLHFLPSFTHNWNFSIIFKNKKVRALKVGKIGSIFG